MAATSTSTATTTTAARPTTTTTPPRPQPPHPIPHHHHNIYTSQNLPVRPQTPNLSSTQQQQQGGTILYPVASSGRGFIPRPVRSQDQTVTVANPSNPNLTASAYHARAHRLTPIASASASASASARAHPHFDQHSHSVHMMRHHPTYLQQQHQHHYVGAAPIKGVPVASGQLRVAPSPSPVSDSNGYKNLRSREDKLVVVRDRKVRISDAASLYVLCRSWLRNGFSEESQPHNGDVIKSLPRPLPIPVIDTPSPKKGGEEVEDEEDEESVADLSTEDLLKRHINRAKKVRARLRERRLKRIARYKTRFALLLPPQVEQFRTDTAGN